LLIIPTDELPATSPLYYGSFMTNQSPINAIHAKYA